MFQIYNLLIVATKNSKDSAKTWVQHNIWNINSTVRIYCSRILIEIVYLVLLMFETKKNTESILAQHYRTSKSYCSNYWWKLWHGLRFKTLIICLQDFFLPNHISYFKESWSNWCIVIVHLYCPQLFLESFC